MRRDYHNETVGRLNERIDDLEANLAVWRLIGCTLGMVLVCMLFS